MNEYEQELLTEARELLEVDANAKDQGLVCECMCISMQDIRDHIGSKQLDLSILSKELKLGSGCSSCVNNFKQWKDKI